MADNYELPDIRTPEVEDAEELKVEVVDDTPPQDRGRTPLPKDVVEELDKDDLEEYSEKVKKRLSQMKKAWHDERREKEAAAREREEAFQFAQLAHQENLALKQRLGTGERVFASEMTKSANIEVAAAKDKLKQAYESGDAERITEAQEILTDAKLKLREISRFTPSLQEENNTVQTQQQVRVAPTPHVDRKAEAWRDNNEWFGSNKGMTAFALGLHEELVESGADPRSDDYYRQVDKTMRKRFPDYFGEEPTYSEERGEKPTSRKTNTVVAPATRSTAPRSIRLSSSQAAIAKRLGLTPEAYARELMKLENNNG